MTLAERRRYLIALQKKSWDIVWTYDMGRLADNGFSEAITGNASGLLKNDGYYLTSYNSEALDYIRFRPSVTTCLGGVVEVQIKILEFAPRFNGFRLTLSNGIEGAQIAINKGNLYVLKEGETATGEASYASPSICATLNVNTDYLLRMEFDINNGTKVYLDNILVYDKKNFSNVYCTINNIYQQSGGQTILKSLKYKFIR